MMRCGRSKSKLNGKRLCVAGIGDDGVLNTMVDYVVDQSGSRLHLRVGGLSSPTEEHATWRTLALKVGDKVAVTIIETNSVDKPTKRYRLDSKAAEVNEKAYVQAKAHAFGWQIRMPREKTKS